MTSVQTFKRALSSVMRLWAEEAYDQALERVEGLLEEWPGNSHLHILRASLVQLQQDPKNSLDEAKQALRRAIELDKDSPVGPIELGHFLDAVEDGPQAALRAYTAGVVSARRLLIEGLIGQAKALLQLHNEKEFHECLLELLNLMHFEPTSKGSKSEGLPPDVILESPAGRVYAVQLKGPYAKQIEDLLDGMRSNRSA